MAARCPSGHELAWPLGGRACPRCRRETVVAAVSAADPSLPAAVIAAAVDAVAPGGQALRQLADALAADPAALTAGAPPVAGRLAAELIARGSAVLAIPACAVCGRAGRPLFRGDGGGVCQRCRSWQRAVACASCGKVRPRAGSDAAGQDDLRGVLPPAMTRSATASAAGAARPHRSRSAAGTGARTSA